MPQRRFTNAMFALEIAAWRERLALTQADAAVALGISERQYQLYETGRSPIPRVVYLATRALEPSRPRPE